MKRRAFLNQSALTAASLTILPGGIISGKTSPNNKLNIALSVEEARTLRTNWLAHKGKLATQCGTQMHAQPNYRRIKEMVLDGAIGELKAATAWGNRKLPRNGYYPGVGKPPADLHWDRWLGPSPEHPYHPDYFSGRPGANCLQWNMFWDWGVGQIGDMGSHFMDMLYSVTDAELPTAVKASGEAFNPEVTPVEFETHFHHPANDWRGPIRVSWHQGGRFPRNPRPFIDFNKIGHGAMFHGSKGFIIADYTKRLLIPSGKEADLSYYQPRSKEEQLPAIPSFYQEWVDACKDPSKLTCCDFEYHSQMIEQMLLGLVAYRSGGELGYNGETGLTDNDAANALLKRSYRKGWNLNG